MIAGYVDALAYLTLHAFVANLTGTAVLLGVSLAAGDWPRVIRAVAAIGAFLCGAVATRLILRVGWRPRYPLLLAGVILAGAAFLPDQYRLPVLALAMGGQNAALTKFGLLSINTTFISGDLQKLAQALGDRPTASTRSAITALPLVWLAYVGGAAMGAVAVSRSSVLLFALQADWGLLVAAIGLVAVSLAL